MLRMISTALISAAMALGAGASALAQNVVAVERSGNTFHVAACPGRAGAGTARCHAHLVTDRTGNPVSRDLAPNITPSGLSPAALRSAYKVTSTGSAANVVVIVDAYGYANAETDLNVYRAQFGMTACTTANGCFKKLNQNGQQGNYPQQNTGWAQETALDLDMASAMCPGCSIVLVEATSATFANLAAAENTAAAVPGVRAISNSYGGGENGSSGYESAYSHANIAITVSSGDSGYGVQFPASSPHVTAVGGTSLSPASNSRGWSETAWSGAGSGCSALYTKPSWQTDTGCANRTVADVSAVADPNTGVAVYGPSRGNRSAWLVFGGTSVAAPLIAGLYGNNGATAFYGSDPYSHTTSLNDVTSGSNGSCSPSYLCTAGAGYDGPTGLGTPIGTTPF
ncbi:MAG TPA: S53 family peptidase [Caulobacteraceae bacterium]